MRLVTHPLAVEEQAPRVVPTNLAAGMDSDYMMRNETVSAKNSKSHPRFNFFHQVLSTRDTHPNEPRGRGCWFIWSMLGRDEAPPPADECQLSFPAGFILHA